MNDFEVSALASDKPHKKAASFRLDVISFFISSLRDGLGPLLTLFLVQDVGLSPSEVATCLAATGFGSILAQIPAGFVYDRIRDRRVPLIAGAIAIALCAFGVSRSRSSYEIFALQLACGIAMSFVSEGLPALAVVSVSLSSFGRRIARNELFAKIGAFASLALSGYLAQRLSLKAIFYVTILSGLLVALAAVRVQTVAQRVAPDTDKPREQRYSQLFDRSFLTLLVLCFIYQLSNAPMFMIFEQHLARDHFPRAPALVSALTMATQGLFILFCLIFARQKQLTPRLSFLSIGFVIIVLRGLLLSISVELPAVVISVLLDAMAAGILILIPIQIIARHKPESFNFASSLFGLTVIGGSSLGLTVAGYLLENTSTSFTFVTLATIAGLGLIFMGTSALHESSRRSRELIDS